MWRSFGANFSTTRFSGDTNYDRHGHVGFAWGARWEVLDRCPLYDKGLIGGADHIIAHAAAGQIPHLCITNAFKDDIDNVLNWSKVFFGVVRGQIGFVKGDLYHIWHGDIDKRKYLQRVKEFTIQTKNITRKDSNGLYITDTAGDDAYVRNYFRSREVPPPAVRPPVGYVGVSTAYQPVVVVQQDNSFEESMAIGYMTDSTLAGGVAGGNWMGAMLGQELRDAQEARNHTIVSPPVQQNVPTYTPSNTNAPVILEDPDPAPHNHQHDGNFS